MLRFLLITIVILTSTQVNACGVWGLEDLETDTRVKFYVGTALRYVNSQEQFLFRYDYGNIGHLASDLRRAKASVKMTSHTNEIHMHTTSGKRLFNFRNDSLVVGSSTYIIQVEKTDTTGQQYPFGYIVRVYKNENLVAKSDHAMTFVQSCMRSQVERSDDRNYQLDCEQEQLNDIRYRVAFYLVWRDSFDK